MGYNLKGCDLYVVKRDKGNTNRNNNRNNSKPCHHCIKLIKKTNIKRVFYGVFGQWVCEKVRDISNNHISGYYRRYKNI